MKSPAQSTATLRAHGCTEFAVTIYIAKADFRRDTFLAALQPELSAEFARSGRVRMICYKQIPDVDFSARLFLHEGPQRRKTEVHFHVNIEPDNTAPQEQSLPAERVFDWLRGFIAEAATIGVAEQASFEFSTRLFDSAFSLPLHLSGPLNPTGNGIFEGAQVTTIGIDPKMNLGGFDRIWQTVSPKTIFVSLVRDAKAPVQKLKTVLADIGVLGTVAKATLKPRGRKKR